MTRGILIAGNETALTAAVGAETAGRVERFGLALIPERFSGVNSISQPAKTTAELSLARVPSAFETRVSDTSAAASSEKGRIPLDWNPGSPVSARTLVLSAENRLGRVDEAILICDPPIVRRSGANFGLADIEILLNDHIKGWFFLVKELTTVFKERGGGTLALVFPEGRKDADTDLLAPTALAAFRTLTGGLLAAAPDEPYLTLGFSGVGDDMGFAAFILKTIEEGTRKINGKLHKFGKTGFFR